MYFNLRELEKDYYYYYYYYSSICVKKNYQSFSSNLFNKNSKIVIFSSSEKILFMIQNLLNRKF